MKQTEHDLEKSEEPVVKSYGAKGNSSKRKDSNSNLLLTKVSLLIAFFFYTYIWLFYFLQIRPQIVGDDLDEHADYNCDCQVLKDINEKIILELHEEIYNLKSKIEFYEGNDASLL